MNLKKWYYSNLDSRLDKVYAQELVAAVQRFPAGVMERFPTALQNNEMPETREELCEMIQADGFPEWSYEMLKGALVEDVWIAADWTKLRMLRYVANSDSGAVITTDNAYPIAPYEVIDNTIGFLNHEGLRALYLHWTADPDEDSIEQWHIDALSNLAPTHIEGVLGNFAGVGWIAYWTPEGAQSFLDLWAECSTCDGQMVLNYFQHKVGRQLNGYYVCNPHLALSVFDLQKIFKNQGVFSQSNPFIGKDK